MTFPPIDAGASDPQQTTNDAAPAIITGRMGAPGKSDGQLLEMWKRWKRESFDQRWIFERQWMRNIWYMLNRQWIYFDSRKGQWQDKRLARWIPRPVTNIPDVAVNSVRSQFATINYGTNARPLGDDNEAVVTAGVADKYAPILHDTHKMDAVMNEFDWWLLTTGNAWLHTFVDYDRKYGMIDRPYETCQSCGATYPSDQIAEAGQKCPDCGMNQFAPAVNPDGSPRVDSRPAPQGVTLALSPFEIAFPLMYERYSLAPYTIRMRWRDKNYYEQHEALQQYTKGRDALPFGKQPSERTMQIFKTLPFQSDLGIAPPYFASGGANTDAEGIVEYDVWVKPCADFPDGQVIRIAGDQNERIIHLETDENLPGPLPYHDAKGNPLFPFEHATYKTVGGRALGTGLIDIIIPKVDQLNQLDSHCMMILGRMANPVWLEPKGAEVEKFTGEPGLVVKWNPLIAQGNAKPERIPGENIPPSIFQYRALVKQEIEELAGTYDILKGQRPSGVEAYASLQFLQDRANGRHASAYKSRGAAYKGWFKAALEIEREFGPEQRIKAVMAPTHGWSFEVFKKADLTGTIDIMIEDGTLSPKSQIGERAAIEHLRQLGLLNPSDPDQVMAIYQKFGQQELLPGLDAQVQEAWMNMDRFEKFLQGDRATVLAVQKASQTEMQMAATQKRPPMNIGPLQYKRWYNPQIHRQELIKWCLSDRGRNVFDTYPGAEMYVDAYLSQIDMALMMLQKGIIDVGGVPQQPVAPPNAGPGGNPGPQEQPGQEPSQPGGAGAAMANSNRNAAGAGGSGPVGAQNQGPNQPAEPSALARDVRAIRYLEAQNKG